MPLNHATLLRRLRVPRDNFHERHPAGHPAPESTTCISAGYDWRNAPVCKKYRALNDRVARAVGSYGRAEVLVYLRSIAYLSHA